MADTMASGYNIQPYTGNMPTTSFSPTITSSSLLGYGGNSNNSFLNGSNNFMSDIFNMGTHMGTDYMNQLGIGLGDMSDKQIYNYVNLSNLDRLNQGPSLMDIGSGLMQAYNVFNQVGMQRDYMDLYREQLGMAKEQWQMTKDEVARISRVRDSLSAQYG